MVKKIYMPMCGGTIYAGSKKHINGKGGAVLLNGGMGGPGAGSSYYSLDDYINTTGLDPYAKNTKSGRGIKNNSSLNFKLEQLTAKPNKKKEKNINFNL
jgi:hypothetical protein